MTVYTWVNYEFVLRKFRPCELHGEENIRKITVPVTANKVQKALKEQFIGQKKNNTIIFLTNFNESLIKYMMHHSKISEKHGKNS